CDNPQHMSRIDGVVVESAFVRFVEGFQKVRLRPGFVSRAVLEPARLQIYPYLDDFRRSRRNLGKLGPTLVELSLEPQCAAYLGVYLVRATRCVFEGCDKPIITVCGVADVPEGVDLFTGHSLRPPLSRFAHQEFPKTSVAD